MKHFATLFSITLLGLNFALAQDITLFQQYNGRYDYTAIGNTLNQQENNIFQGFCETLPSSSATLSLPPNTNIIAAYLYWSGSGNGDLEVTLNATDIVAEDTYIVDFNADPNGQLTYFSCYAEVTNQILNQGNTTYELFNLDISETLINNPGYCNNRTNYAGWSLYVIYEDNSLPLNQVNLFQGLEIINTNVTEKTIFLNNVNVFDNDNAKIGFLAWEGDNNLNIQESLSINNNIISNPPLNLANNAFNGTNTFTNSTTFYNGDLDVYDIENNIQIGDTQVEIQLTTGADLIIINNIITVLNSQLPDATIEIDNYSISCANRETLVNYTVYNTNSTNTLPSNTPISFFIDNMLIGQTFTQNDIPINGFEVGAITLEIPSTIPDDFILVAIVDDDGQGNSTVLETNENNNYSEITINLIPQPEIIPLEAILECDLDSNTAIFDLSLALLEIDTSNYSNFLFYESLEDLELDENEILTAENYNSQTTPQTIYIKAETNICFDIYTLPLTTENCPPYVPEGFSPNNDGYNDFFNIQGLYNVFENHELYIYNRYGTLVFKGNNNLKWNGIPNQGINQSKVVPTGTYFYVLNLNDANYSYITGWVYLNK